MSIRKNPIAYVALFIALGGTAYAASSLPPGSVGTRALKNGAVTDIKVRPHSLGRGVFVPGALPTGLHVSVQSVGVGPPSQGEPPAGTPIDIDVPCPSGQHALSGGWDLSTVSGSANVTVSKPYANDTGWMITFIPSQEPFGVAWGYAVCGS